MTNSYGPGDERKSEYDMPEKPRPKLPGRPLSVKEFQATVHGLTRRATRAARGSRSAH